ncbi:J domain-containing protein [Isosphaeraceae bacterium EP7]
MATRPHPRGTMRILSGAAIALGWYLASILAYGGALWLIDHCRPPHSRHAVMILDHATFAALAMWLVGLASMFLVQQFIDGQFLRYVTILPFAFSWYLCLVTTIEWFNEPSAVARNPEFDAAHPPAEKSDWWYYPLRFALVGLPAPAWLLTFRSMHRRESVGYRRDLVESIYEKLSIRRLGGRRARIQGDARLGGVFAAIADPPPRREPPRNDGPGRGSTQVFDSPGSRSDLGILGLKVGATAEEVRQAYRSLVLAWHPDRFPIDPHLRAVAQEKMSEINAAHDRLELHLANRTCG